MICKKAKSKVESIKEREEEESFYLKYKICPHCGGNTTTK